MIPNEKEPKEIAEILLPPTQYSRPDDANTRGIIATYIQKERSVWSKDLSDFLLQIQSVQDKLWSAEKRCQELEKKLIDLNLTMGNNLL